jgi:hypothetical protein
MILASLLFLSIATYSPSDDYTVGIAPKSRLEQVAVKSAPPPDPFEAELRRYPKKLKQKAFLLESQQLSTSLILAHDKGLC